MVQLDTFWKKYSLKKILTIKVLLVTFLRIKKKIKYLTEVWPWKLKFKIQILFGIYAWKFLIYFQKTSTNPTNHVTFRLKSVLFGYHKVASSRPVYYSNLNFFGQWSQYIRIKFPVHKESENPWACYQLRCAPARNFTLIKPRRKADLPSQ